MLEKMFWVVDKTRLREGAMLLTNLLHRSTIGKNTPTKKAPGTDIMRPHRSVF